MKCKEYDETNDFIGHESVMEGTKGFQIDGETIFNDDAEAINDSMKSAKQVLYEAAHILGFTHAIILRKLKRPGCFQWISDEVKKPDKRIIDFVNGLGINLNYNDPDAVIEKEVEKMYFYDKKEVKDKGNKAKPAFCLSRYRIFGNINRFWIGKDLKLGQKIILEDKIIKKRDCLFTHPSIRTMSRKVVKIVSEGKYINSETKMTKENTNQRIAKRINIIGKNFKLTCSNSSDKFKKGCNIVRLLNNDGIEFIFNMADIIYKSIEVNKTKQAIEMKTTRKKG